MMAMLPRVGPSPLKPPARHRGVSAPGCVVFMACISCLERPAARRVPRSFGGGGVTASLVGVASLVAHGLKGLSSKMERLSGSVSGTSSASSSTGAKFSGPWYGT